MNLTCVLTLLMLYVRHVSSRLDTLKTVEDYMNICLDGRNQKSSPGSEPKLLSRVCSPWAARSCCTPETAEGISINPRWLNFAWDHCKNLSPRCREFFIMDLCFYECSPNVGPWLVLDERKIRKERFLDVPLCQTVCDDWWNACKNDFTCVENWAVGFNWSTGINTCPKESICRPFHAIYNGSNHFCEKLMGHSFRVVPDTPDCFVLWFDPNNTNPNEAVAKKKASALLGVPYDISSGNNLENMLYQYLLCTFLFVIGY